MNWTVRRRILLGFAIGAGLVALVAVIGIWAIRQTASAYTDALTAERQVLLRAIEARGNARNANIAYLRYLVDGLPEHLRERDEAVRNARTEMTELRAITSGADAQEWAEALSLFTDWDAATTRVASLYTTGQTEEAMRVRSEQVQPLRDRLETVIGNAATVALARTDSVSAQAGARAASAEGAMGVGFFLTLIAFVVVGYLLTRAVSKPLQDTSTVLATSATEILSTTTEQAAGATESLAAVTQTAATVDQVVQTAEQSADRARAVAASAQRAADIGKQGQQAVELSGNAIDNLREQMEAIAGTIVILSEQAQAIGGIIATVTDFADQTNMLALNAAIEAARAGEQGRGFAVVAGEVRNLAEQSKSGTARVRQILEQIQSATSAAVSATDEGNRRVTEVSRQVREAGETIRQLADAAGQAAQAAAQIAASAGQQSAGMSQIRQAIANVQQAAQQNLAATRQAEVAARELNRLGSRLVHLVDGAHPAQH